MKLDMGKTHVVAPLQNYWIEFWAALKKWQATNPFSLSIISLCGFPCVHCKQGQVSHNRGVLEKLLSQRPGILPKKHSKLRCGPNVNISTVQVMLRTRLFCCLMKNSVNCLDSTQEEMIFILNRIWIVFLLCFLHLKVFLIQGWYLFFSWALFFWKM